ncbi:MAG: hypothetical protein ACR2JM_07025 [Mycobacterium sp.]
MPSGSRPRRVLTAGLLAAGVMLGIAPAASAEGIPNPDPAPMPDMGSGAGLCQDGEVMQDGNCVPAMSPVGSDAAAVAPQPAVTGIGPESSSTTSYSDPAYSVPNINGDPCTGAWESTACYAMNMGDSGPAVVPHSTLSSSP